jgi:hypothetical protein
VALGNRVNAVQSTVVWLQRGRQLSALVQELRFPMTSSQLWQRARVLAPRLRLRDVWFGLRKLTARGLVFCLNPSLGNGRVFFLTDFGRAVVEEGFGLRAASLPARLNWNRFGEVARARVRRRILEEIARPSFHGGTGKSTAEIRRNLLERTPMELSRAIRAVNELTCFKLIRVAGLMPKPKRKLYVLTPAGRRVVEALKRCEQQSNTADLPQQPRRE